MPNSTKLKGVGPTIVPYSFSSNLLSDMGYKEEEFEVETLGTNENKMSFEDEKLNITSEAEKQAAQLVEAAEYRATEILEEAARKAEELKNVAQDEGYKAGFGIGRKVGEEIAFKENKERLELDAAVFLQELQRSMAELEKKKDELLKKHSDELCNLALTIAEKIIKISLKSSTEVITKMILAATEKSKNKEWARIHISNYDANLMVHGEADLLNQVQQISPHVKVVIMENKQPGTCIIEFPDQIIDASVNTQLDNIKELLDENSLNGGM